jgi:hypothetical protein
MVQMALSLLVVCGGSGVCRYELFGMDCEVSFACHIVDDNV